MIELLKREDFGGALLLMSRIVRNVESGRPNLVCQAALVAIVTARVNRARAAYFFLNNFLARPDQNPGSDWYRFVALIRDQIGQKLVRDADQIWFGA